MSDVEAMEAFTEIGLRITALRLASRIDAARERNSETVAMGTLLADEIVRNMRKAADELDRHALWVSDLQSGMFVNCVYCGHRYGPKETTPVTMADALKAHVAQCSEHPMSGLLKSLKELRHHFIFDEEGGLTRGEFEAMFARADAAIVAAGSTVQEP